MEKLNGKVKAAMQRSGETRSPLSSKLSEMNDAYRQVERLAEQRRNELIDKLQQVSDALTPAPQLQDPGDFTTTPAARGREISHPERRRLPP